jgi:hypothetical protein
MAAEAGTPIAAINLGHTRADGLLALKVQDDCARVLSALAGRVADPDEGSAAAAANAGACDGL